jgi:hypothetical protein
MKYIKNPIIVVSAIILVLAIIGGYWYVKHSKSLSAVKTVEQSNQLSLAESKSNEPVSSVTEEGLPTVAVEEKVNPTSNKSVKPVISVDKKYKDLDSNDGDDTTVDHVLDKDKDGNLVAVDPNKLSPEQQKIVAEQHALYIIYKPTYLKVVELLRKKDIEGLVSMTHPCIINKYGQEGVASTYQDSYVPFFEDYGSVNLDSGTTSKYIGPCGSEGLLFGEIMITSSGQKKNFIIVLVRSGSGIYVVDIVKNKQISDFH